MPEKINLNSEKIRQQRLSKLVSDIFLSVGFTRSLAARDAAFSFNGVSSDFDDVFTLENIIVVVEYTVTKDVIGHFKGKDHIYSKVLTEKIAFIDYFKAQILEPGFLNPKYSTTKLKIIVVYCPENEYKDSLIRQLNGVKLLDNMARQYFRLVTKTIKRSALHEFLDFLGVKCSEFADRVFSPANATDLSSFEGSILPEEHSRFPAGYKVVSFYMQPAALLERAYVLRRDGWRDKHGTYQRMIISTKLEKIRRYLLSNQRVFINNIIVTLPPNTKILDNEGNTQDTTNITSTKPVWVSIPREFNSVGLIDGQHRVFSYYNGGKDEERISVFRNQQNLLVTGIIYPDGVSVEEKIRFEANLFFDINANQSNANSNIKQAINKIIRPFTDDAVAQEVLDALNENRSPLENLFSRSIFDTSRLKTSTIVNYGLKPLVKIDPDGPIFKYWSYPNKIDVFKNEDKNGRANYIGFCVSTISEFFEALRMTVHPTRWTTSDDVRDRLLVPTNIIGIMGALRHALAANKKYSRSELANKFKEIREFEFNNYKSSQYTKMSTALYERYLL